MFSLSKIDLDVVQLKQQVINPQSGGFVSFEGWVRNHNAINEGQKQAATAKSVTELHYEAHEKLAIQVGNEIVIDALKKFEINVAICCHRVGKLKVGDMAIWVGVSADHRQAAFLACEYILNQTKACVPIWKNEFYLDGQSGWVDAKL